MRRWDAAESGADSVCYAPNAGQKEMEVEVDAIPDGARLRRRIFWFIPARGIIRKKHQTCFEALWREACEIGDPDGSCSAERVRGRRFGPEAARISSLLVGNGEGQRGRAAELAFADGHHEWPVEGRTSL